MSTLPFMDRPCEICLQEGKGNFMVLNLNDEIKHIAAVHKDMALKFKCTRCNKEYIKKHSALCHMPKCSGPRAPAIENEHKCQNCGKSFLTKSGLSQHERHQHPLIRNEKWATEASGNKTRPKPMGYEQVWSKEEVKLMLRLETDLRNERNIAQQMCQYLPGKTNKQIRDKRAETTYKRKREERLNKQPIIQTEDRREDLSGGTEWTPKEGRALRGPTNKESIAGTHTIIPVITVTDLSRQSDLAKREWQKSFILASKQPEATVYKTVTEDTIKWKTMKDVLKNAEEEDGQVPTSHIDYIYSVRQHNFLF
jgi:hypothetical protein